MVIMKAQAQDIIDELAADMAKYMKEQPDWPMYEVRMINEGDGLQITVKPSSMRIDGFAIDSAPVITVWVRATDPGDAVKRAWDKARVEKEAIDQALGETRSKLPETCTW
jgi:hypothetical protein